MARDELEERGWIYTPSPEMGTFYKLKGYSWPPRYVKGKYEFELHNNVLWEREDEWSLKKVGIFHSLKQLESHAI